MCNSMFFFLLRSNGALVSNDIGLYYSEENGTIFSFSVLLHI